MPRATTVDAFLAGHDHYRKELTRLREILLSTGLDETVKWGQPCYVYQNKNVVAIGAFKAYFGLWFYQGALLDDAAGHLVNAQEGRTRAMRQWRMQRGADIKVRQIKAYVKEAQQLVDQGQEIKPERGKSVVVPNELRIALDANAKACRAFAKLTLGRQREYAEHISGAKRESTRQSRVQKILPLIAAGQGLNDKYR